MWKMTIQYTVLGFNPTIFKTWVSPPITTRPGLLPQRHFFEIVESRKIKIRWPPFHWKKANALPTNNLLEHSAMELFSRRRRRRVSTQLSIKFVYCPWCTVSYFCIFINTTAYHWADASLHLSLAVALPNWAFSMDNVLRMRCYLLPLNKSRIGHSKIWEYLSVQNEHTYIFKSVFLKNILHYFW